MASWPSISNPDFGLKETVYRPQVRQEFESNYVQSRPRTTRATKRWALSWAALTEADYQTLLTFFNTYQGSSFTWTHPVSAVSYTCRFSGDTLESEITLTGYRRVSLQIEEV